MDKLRVSEVEVGREQSADGEKNQNVTAGIFALIEPRYCRLFKSMLEAMDDAFTGSSSFESAVEDVVRNTVDDIDFLDDDAVNDRIAEAISDSQFIRQLRTWCAR